MDRKITGVDSGTWINSEPFSGGDFANSGLFFYIFHVFLHISYLFLHIFCIFKLPYTWAVGLGKITSFSARGEGGVNMGGQDVNSRFKGYPRKRHETCQ